MKKISFEMRKYNSVSEEIIRFVKWVTETSCNRERSFLKLIELSLLELIKNPSFNTSVKVSVYNFIILILKNGIYLKRDYVILLLEAYRKDIEHHFEEIDKELKRRSFNDARYYSPHLDFQEGCLIDPLKIYLKYNRKHSIIINDKFELTIAFNSSNEIEVYCREIENGEIKFNVSFEPSEDIYACSTFIGEYCFILTEINNYPYQGEYTQGRLLSKEHLRYRV